MKKLLIISFSLAFLAISCRQKEVYGTDGNAARKFIGKIIYMKDTTANLCYAVTGTGERESLNQASAFTCVPCDSVKNLIH